MFQIQTGTQNKILRTHCDLVTVFDESLQSTVDEMKDTMLEPTDEGVTGVGLAANQVGINKRILLITQNIDTKKQKKIMVFINPEILELSSTLTVMEEGCLSLPHVYANVSRSKKVKVKWQNEKGNWCEKKLEKWDARIFLHEYDHLEGILFTDLLSKKNKEKALKELLINN